MKILFVLEYYLPHIGGVETVFEELGKKFVALGHEVHIVTMKLPGTNSFEEIDRIKVHRVAVPSFGSRYWFDFLFSVPEIYRVAKECDIIHSSDYITAFPVWLVAVLLKKPKITTVTEPIGAMWNTVLGVNCVKSFLFRGLEKFLLKLPFDKYICISYYTKNCLRFMGIRDEKLLTTYLGIDNVLFNPNRDRFVDVRSKYGLKDNFTYLSFGRPGITKGIDYLLQAVPLIEEQTPNSSLLLILSQDPPDRYQHLLRMISDLQLSNVILLEPVQRDLLPDFIAASDCVVVPSLTEGFGFTAAEACAMGKPVVATNIGSLPEVVSGRFILVEPRNSKAIAEAVTQVANGITSTTERKDFDWSKCAYEYLKIYGNLIQ